MLTKKGLMEKFQKRPEAYWSVPLFEEQGFVRKGCACGKFFWTLDHERKVCGDSSCERYGFIGNTVTKKRWDYVQMWKEFEKFFKKNSHTSIPRYPVVDRWRPDLYFTIASIQDFQRLDRGRLVMEYPADPLIVPQACLRFSDIANVGVTGRHHTSFVMSGQHSFGNYWKEQCIELNFRFLHKKMGIPKERLVYVEDLWSMPDYSQFGPSLETVSEGLELVNAVFSQFTATGSGFKDLPSKVIDVGWGHERLVWFSHGTATGYDAVFGPVVKWMKKETGVNGDELFNHYAAVAGSLDINEVQNRKEARERLAQTLGTTIEQLNRSVEPLQAIYAIADHVKSLLFAITDGGIPSNVGGGYNLRVILRRALSFIEECGFAFDVMKVAELHVRHLRGMFPELKGGLEPFSNILAAEEEKYRRTRAKAASIVRKELKNGIGESQLITLYTSHGIAPELVETIAEKQGKHVSVPDRFYQKVTALHMGKTAKKEELGVDVSGSQPTELLYYNDSCQKEMNARVVGVFEIGNDVWAALDRTVFYPEGGGQPADHGILLSEGKEIRVADVQKIGGVVVHRIDSPVRKGQYVKGVVNWKRRSILTKMHDATHIMAGACRTVLGRSAWQAGAQKGVESSRLDITHYMPFSGDIVKRIEKEANDAVKKNLPITAIFMPRKEAEGTYGFTLYQGGASPGKEVRVVKIAGHDVEACGGTHNSTTKDVGTIRIIRVERIQDGVNRIEFTCGEAAVDFVKDMEELREVVLGIFRKNNITAEDGGDAFASLQEAAKVFSVDMRQLPRTVERFLGEVTHKEQVQGNDLKALSNSLFTVWKMCMKEHEQTCKENAKRTAAELLKKVKGRQIFDVVAGERKELIQIASDILRARNDITVILSNQAGDVVGMSKTRDMGAVIQDICKKAGGSGGGGVELAQGKVKLSKLLKFMTV